MDEQEAYCSNCGAVSAEVKANAKGIVFIPLDKIIPYGTLLITCGIFLNIIGFILFQKIIPIFFGIGLAIAVVGIVMVAQYKKTLKFGQNYTVKHKNDDENPKCRFCNNPLKQDGKYCTLCGSKARY